ELLGALVFGREPDACDEKIGPLERRRVYPLTVAVVGLPVETIFLDAHLRCFERHLLRGRHETVEEDAGALAVDRFVECLLKCMERVFGLVLELPPVFWLRTPDRAVVGPAHLVEVLVLRAHTHDHLHALPERLGCCSVDLHENVVKRAAVIFTIGPALHEERQLLAHAPPYPDRSAANEDCADTVRATGFLSARR